MKKLNFSALALLFNTSTLIFATTATAQDEARWFEVEVIIFQQLHDKSTLKETFPEFQPVKTPAKTREILTPFLHPNIASLKQLLPDCGHNSHWNDSLLIQSIQKFNQQSIEQLFSLKSIDDIESLVDEPYDYSEFDQTERNRELSNDTNSSLSTTVEESSLTENQTNNLPQLSITQEEPFPPLTEQEQKLFQQAEDYFTAQQFSYSKNQFPRTICHVIINGKNNDDFTIKKVPTVINAADLDNTPFMDNAPYLLSADKLQLTNIVTDLSNSKHFKPLLHIGWRQAPKTRNKAIPVHLFAGKNLKAEYQQQLEDYLAKKAAFENEQKTINEENPHLNLTDENTSNSAMLLQKSIRDNDKIKQIVDKFNRLTLSPEQLINDIKLRPLAFPTENKTEQPGDISQQFSLKPPEKPLQDWFLDGYFKVHLNHYLFIDADFNMLTKNNAALATQRLIETVTSQNKKNEQTLPPAIHFKQNRRVISQEIHYFDHPYMGIIVQIRRYTPPEPAEISDEDVSKVNN